MAGTRLIRIDRKTTISREQVRKIVKEVFSEDKPKEKKPSKGGDADKLAKAS